MRFTYSVNTGLHAEQPCPGSFRNNLQALQHFFLRRGKEESAVRDCSKQPKWLLEAKSSLWLPGYHLEGKEHKLLLKYIGLPNLKMPCKEPWISAFQCLTFLLSAHLQCSAAHLSQPTRRKGSLHVFHILKYGSWLLSSHFCNIDFHHWSQVFWAKAPGSYEVAQPLNLCLCCPQLVGDCAGQFSSATRCTITRLSLLISPWQKPEPRCCRGQAEVKTKILFSPSWNASENLAMWHSTFAEAVCGVDGPGKRVPPPSSESPAVRRSCGSPMHRAGNISPDMLHWEIPDDMHKVCSSKGNLMVMWHWNALFHMFMIPKRSWTFAWTIRNIQISDTQSFCSTHPSGLQLVHTFSRRVVFCVPCDPPSLLKEWIKQEGRVVTGYFLSTWIRIPYWQN